MMTAYGRGGTGRLAGRLGWDDEPTNAFMPIIRKVDRSRKGIVSECVNDYR